MKTLVAYLQLLRVGNVFTALADIFLGWLLTHDSFEPTVRFIGLLVASAGLYLAGMVLNDFWDRDVDRVERPGRPIPSGRITPAAASDLGFGLLLLGAAAAACVGPHSLIVAVALAACVLAYDGGMKRTIVGPVFMGGCRFLNVLLGASASAGDWSDFNRLTPPWLEPALLAPLLAATGFGIYIAGVTWFARKEAERSSRASLIGALLTINCGLGLLLYLVNQSGPRRLNALLMVGMVAVIINRRLSRAVQDPSPPLVQASIKTLLLSLITLDASIVFAFQENPAYAFCVLCLLLPATTVSRFIPVT